MPPLISPVILLCRRSYLLRDEYKTALFITWTIPKVVISVHLNPTSLSPRHFLLALEACEEGSSSPGSAVKGVSGSARISLAPPCSLFFPASSGAGSRPSVFVLSPSRVALGLAVNEFAILALVLALLSAPDSPLCLAFFNSSFNTSSPSSSCSVSSSSLPSKNRSLHLAESCLASLDSAALLEFELE